MFIDFSNFLLRAVFPVWCTEFMEFEMSKMAQPFVISVDDSKKPVTVWAKYFSCASEGFHLALFENAMCY